jgi:hypothetical protein
MRLPPRSAAELLDAVNLDWQGVLLVERALPKTSGRLRDDAIQAQRTSSSGMQLFRDQVEIEPSTSHANA